MKNTSNLAKDLINKRFLIYGLGETGKSVIRFFRQKKISQYYVWDDSTIEKKYLNKKFDGDFDKVDFIVVSPGVRIEKTLFKLKLKKNKKKIISDLDLFYIFNPEAITIGVTGTNGKSTTCKLIFEILKKNNFNVKIGGNIGYPILNISCNKKSIVVIEMSSFQLAYSKFIRPNHSILLNLSLDHLDWHKNFYNYKRSKFRIFLNQQKKDFAYFKSNSLIKFFKNEKFKSKIVKIRKNFHLNLKKIIKNDYLIFKPNIENLSFAYEIAKNFNLSQKSILNSLKDFKGLSHRYEIFLKKKNFVFINDSKATSFKSTSYSLEANKNIYWIVGGLPKMGDKIKIHNLRKNLAKTYIIGKNTSFFSKQLRKESIDYKICNKLKNAIIKIFNDIKDHKRKCVVLFSPASASYDQYKNFEDRGDSFKNLIKYYAKRYI